VKNPVRTNDVRWREHGASSMEKAICIWGLIAEGRPQTYMAVHRSSVEQGIMAFSRSTGESQP
jgi:hypothetical protein